MANMTLRRRTAMRGAGSSVDWESIARGMIDLTTQFEIPSDMPIIPTDYLFCGRMGLTGGIIISPNATSIGNSAFMGCVGLTDVIMEDNSIVTIKLKAFSGCTALTTISIPEGVTKIENEAFYRCPLTDINLPSTLTEIGQYFTLGSRITSITVPASVTKIGNYFLPSATLLQEIILQPTTPPVLGGINLVSWGSTTYTIYVPDESVAAYKAANNWSAFASLIKGISERPTT